MHSEVSHGELSPLVRPLVFPSVALHCHGLCLAFTPSGGLAPDGFAGIIPLSKNSAPDPDVCGSNLYLQRQRGAAQGRAATTPQPSLGSHSMVPHGLSTHSYAQGLL